MVLLEASRVTEFSHRAQISATGEQPVSLSASMGPVSRSREGTRSEQDATGRTCNPPTADRPDTLGLVNASRRSPPTFARRTPPYAPHGPHGDGRCVALRGRDAARTPGAFTRLYCAVCDAGTKRCSREGGAARGIRRGEGRRTGSCTDARGPCMREERKASSYTLTPSKPDFRLLGVRENIFLSFLLFRSHLHPYTLYPPFSKGK